MRLKHIFIVQNASDGNTAGQLVDCAVHIILMQHGGLVFVAKGCSGKIHHVLFGNFVGYTQCVDMDIA